jgi:hypothetical protein
LNTQNEYRRVMLMNIDKAIKKQRSRYKRFLVAMNMLIIALPVFLYFSRQINTFFVIYLIIIEVLIILFEAFEINSESLSYEVDTNKIKITTGFPPKLISIPREKIELIHAEGNNIDMHLVLICKAKLRNRCVKPVDIYFLKNYPYAGYHYGKLKKRNLEQEYFYAIIKTGGYKKYSLLNEIYKGCPTATFTEESIAKIKEYRNIIE